MRRYELLSGRKKIKIKLKGRSYKLSLESREQDYFSIRVNEQMLKFRATMDQSEIHLDLDGHMYTIRRTDISDERYIRQSGEKSKHSSDQILAPLNGRIIEIRHAEGDEVRKGQTLLLIESMKMENKILAPQGATIKKLHVSVGNQVHNMQLLFTLDTND